MFLHTTLQKNGFPLAQPVEHQLAKRFFGKLLLRHEIPIPDDLFYQLVNHRYFSPTPSIQKQRFQLTCLRCNNQKRSLFGKLPCHSCQDMHWYCRKCIEMGRVIECEPLYRWTGLRPTYPPISEPCTWNGQLADNQINAAKRILTAIDQQEEQLLIWGVCGSGKTEMLFPGLTQAIRLGKRICLATPRADVVRELLPRLQDAFAPVEIQALYGGSKDREATAPFIVATTHQLLRFEKAFDVMIIDEVDAFPFHKDSSLPFATKRACQETSTIIYLTATPREEQKQAMHRKKLPYMFVPKRFHGHPLPVPTFKMCFSLSKSLAANRPPSALLTWFQHRQNNHRQVLIFVPTIKLAERLTVHLQQLFIEKQLITSRQQLQFVHAEDKQREEKIALFRNKEILILVTTTILERGVTFPAIDVIVLDAGHEVFDEAALVQIAGRAGRSPKDPTGEVIFMHEGKTEAMVQAVSLIQAMNKRGGKLA